MLRLSINQFSDVVGKEFNKQQVLLPRLATNGSGSSGVESDGNTDHATKLSKVKKKWIVGFLLDPTGIDVGS